MNPNDAARWGSPDAAADRLRTDDGRGSLAYRRRIAERVAYVEGVGMSRTRPFDVTDAELAAFARFGDAPPPVGTVLRWQGPNGSEWIARHDQDGVWEIAGEDGVGIRWPILAARIADAPCQVAVGWREIPRPEPVPAGDDAVKDWAAQFLGESAAEPVAMPTATEARTAWQDVPAPAPMEDVAEAPRAYPDVTPDGVSTRYSGRAGG